MASFSDEFKSLLQLPEAIFKATQAKSTAKEVAALLAKATTTKTSTKTSTPAIILKPQTKALDVVGFLKQQRGKSAESERQFGELQRDVFSTAFPGIAREDIKVLDPFGQLGLTGEIKAAKAGVDVARQFLKARVSTGIDDIVKIPRKERFYSFFNGLYTTTVDRFNPIVRLVRTAEKTGALTPGRNPELLARTYLGSKGIAEHSLYYNVTSLDKAGNLVNKGPGLQKIIQPFSDNLDDLRAMLVAERDIELAARGIKGSTPKESRRVITHLSKKYGEKFKELEGTAQGVRQYARTALLEPLREAGIISQEAFSKVVSSNEFYVPFNRVMDDLTKRGVVPTSRKIFQPKTTGLKGIRGSTRKIIDPLEQIIADTYRVTDLVHRHSVAKAIVGLRSISDEMAQLVKPIKPKFVPVAKEGEKTIFRPSFFNPTDNSIMIFENGKRKFFEVSDDLAKAMNGMTAGDANIIVKILALPARSLRAGATGTPDFAIRNLFRDQLSAFVQSKYGYKPFVDTVPGLWALIGRGETYQRWLASGGAHSMFVSLDRAASQKTLQDLAAKKLGAMSPQEAAKALAKVSKGLIKRPLGPLRGLSMASEQATRLGAFRRATKKGATDIEAAFEARELTLDFARLGTATKSVNQIVAFFNANIQGGDKLIRTFAKMPFRATFRAVAGITVPSVSLYFLNRDNPRYRELPSWQKDLFWIIPVEDGPIIRIPKPFTLGLVFGTVPERILQWVDENDPQALRTIPKSLQEGAFPGFVPNAILPIMENQANYSFFRDRPIVSESISGLPPELQANTYTSETAKEVGKLIKKSPAKLENMVNGYFGGMGRYALEASDFLLEKAGVVSPPPEPEKELADFPVIKAFIAREPIGTGSESVNKMFELFEKAEEAERAAKLLMNQGDDEGAIKIIQENTEIKYLKGMRGLVRDFADVRKAKDAVIISESIDPKEKRQIITELDILMTEMARQAIILIESSQ